MFKVCSIFSQVLKLFLRGDFEQAVKEHKAERHARGFTSWGQFMACLLYTSHMAGLDDIESRTRLTLAKYAFACRVVTLHCTLRKKT